MFRPDAAQPFDQRNLSMALDTRTVSIWTIQGRCKNIGFACSPEGVDLGIENIATTSGGYRAAGRGLNRHRARQAALRRELQKKRTKAAKRVLKRRRRKERRRARDVNHCVSKRIVAEAERTGRGIALEDLKGIRTRVRHRKPQRAAFHSWAFTQLASVPAPASIGAVLDAAGDPAAGRGPAASSARQGREAELQFGDLP